MATGPKISSVWTFISGEVPSRTVGSKKKPSVPRRCAPVIACRTGGDPSRHVLGDAIELFLADERTEIDAVVDTGAHAQRA